MRLRSCTWSQWASCGAAAEAGYLAGRCLHDQQNIKIPNWDCISDSPFLRCSLPTSVVVPNFKKFVFPRFVRKVGEALGEDHRRFHQVSSDPSEKAMAPHSSVLAWRIPGTGKPGGLPSMGPQSRTQLMWLSSSSRPFTRRESLVVTCILLMPLLHRLSCTCN